MSDIFFFFIEICYKQSQLKIVLFVAITQKGGVRAQEYSGKYRYGC